MRSWQRLLLGGVLLAAVAVAGIALNFTLLGLTRDDNEPVGRLSPRAVFTDRPATTTATSPVATTPTTTTGDGDGSAPGGGDGDSDD